MFSTGPIKRSKASLLKASTCSQQQGSAATMEPCTVHSDVFPTLQGICAVTGLYTHGRKPQNPVNAHCSKPLTELREQSIAHVACHSEKSVRTDVPD